MIMKKITALFAAMLLLSCLMIGCAQGDDVQLGSLNTPKQILEELIVGDIEGSFAPFRQEEQTPELEEKMKEYAALLDGREYLRCECVDYEVTGSRKEGLYEETTYHKITLKDNTVLYAVCYGKIDEEGERLVSFDLYTECPW